MNTSEHGSHTPSANDDPPPVPNTGRDARGRFTPGNLGGPGNPFARRVAELRQLMLECVTAKDMEIIVGELIVQAKCGKLAAIKLLFQYVLGKPAATVDPDALDVQELELYRQSLTPTEANELVGQRLPPGPVAEVLRFTAPCVGARFKEGIFGEPPAAPPEGAARAADDDRREAAPEGHDTAERRCETRPSPNGEDRGGDRAAPSPRPNAAPLPNGKTSGPDRPGQRGAATDTRPPSANGSGGDRDAGPGPFPFRK